jgi:uncharacterized protein (TIGR00251 family)
VLYLKKYAKGVTFKVRVQPRGKKNKVVGLLDDALKIKITAPPVDGAANAMCIKFLSSLLKVPKSALEIVSGQTSRIKMIRLTLSKQRDLAATINRLHALVNLAKVKA